MKKLIVTVFAALAAVSSCFATVELSADLNAVPFNLVDVENVDNFYEVVPTGFQAAAVFYFDELKPFNVGLKLELSGEEFSDIRQNSSFTEIDGGFNGRFAIGPALRFSSLTGKHTFHLSPGIYFNAMGMGKERKAENDVYDVLITLEGGVHVDFCYNFWIVQKEAFCLGLNFGTDYGIGAGRSTQTVWRDGSDDFDDFYWSDLNLAQHLKIYTGVTFKL